MYIGLFISSYLADAVGQLHGYEEGEVAAALNLDQATNFTLENEGFEAKKIDETTYEVSMDINKKFPLDQTDSNTPSTDEDNNNNSNDSTEGTDNDSSTGGTSNNNSNNTQNENNPTLEITPSGNTNNTTNNSTSTNNNSTSNNTTNNLPYTGINDFIFPIIFFSILALIIFFGRNINKYKDVN